MCALKEIGVLALGTARMSRLPGCSLKTDEGLKKLGRGADDCRTEAGTNVTAFNCMTISLCILSLSGQKEHALFSGQGKQLRGKEAGQQAIALHFELVNKKEVRNSAKVVDDVRCDCVGHWTAHTEKKQRCRLCIKAYSG